jgi:hypothetical protein
MGVVAYMLVVVTTYEAEVGGSQSEASLGTA